MTFPEEAASYVLFDAETGSNIGSARSRADLFALLDELREHDSERLPLVGVVALDDKGQRIDSTPALSLLADA